jgi:hypothetical protein
MLKKLAVTLRSTPDLPIMSMSLAIPGGVVPKQRPLEDRFVLHSGSGALPSSRVPDISS